MVCPVVFNLWYLLCSTYPVTFLSGYLCVSPIWLLSCVLLCGVSLCPHSTRYPVVSLPVVPAPGSLPVSFLWSPLPVLSVYFLLSPFSLR